MTIKDRIESAIKKYRQRRYLPTMVQLEIKGTAPLSIINIAVISGLLFIFILWAGFTQISQNVVAMGEIIP